MATVPAIEVRFPADPAVAPGDGVPPGDLLQAALLDLGITAIDEGEPGSRLWRVYFASPAQRDEACARLRDDGTAGAACVPLDVEDDGWAARSQAALTAVRVGRIVVTPPWDPAAAGAAETLTIVILPSMGFGTGHHATTRLCLDALQRLSLTGARVLDVGTGSGVLAQAAARLGASTVLGIDDDPDAISAARDSLALNPGVTLQLAVADLRRADLAPADVVTANLTGGLLQATATRLAGLGRRLVLSGFLTAERDAVLAAFPGWTAEHEAAEDGWQVAILARG